MVHLGKAAIVRSILQAERKSKLFSNMAESTPFDMANVADSWFVLFMRALSSGLRIDNVRALAHNVSFVVFNYDRCLEQFLFKAIQQLYAISAQEADRILDTFSIHHPYGVVAPLRTTVDLNGRIPFGGLAESGDKYLLLAQSIKTFTEQLSDPESERRIKQAMEEAECIVFLGFGFHPANLTLLNPERTMAQRPVFATAYGMSESDVNSVFNAVDSMYEKIPRIGSLQNPFIVIDNTAKCLDLFQNYSRAIRGI